MYSKDPDVGSDKRQRMVKFRMVKYGDMANFLCGALLSKMLFQKYQRQILIVYLNIQIASWSEDCLKIMKYFKQIEITFGDFFNRYTNWAKLQSIFSTSIVIKYFFVISCVIFPPSNIDNLFPLEFNQSAKSGKDIFYIFYYE